jgi:hypothetical protein
MSSDKWDDQGDLERDEIRLNRKGKGSELPLPLWAETSEARS